MQPIAEPVIDDESDSLIIEMAAANRLSYQDRRLENYLNFECGHIAKRFISSHSRKGPFEIIHAFIEARSRFADAIGCLALIFKDRERSGDHYYVVHLKNFNSSIHQADNIADTAIDYNKTIYITTNPCVNPEEELVYETQFNIVSNN